MKRILFRRTQRLIIWLGLLPLLLAVAAYRYSSQHAESVDRMLSSSDLIRRLDDLLSTVKDAETGQRGYLLTGDPRYAQPFFEAKKQLDAQFAGAEKLGEKGGADIKKLSKLHQLTSDKMTELRETTKIRNKDGLAAAQSILKKGRDESDMARIRALVRQLRQEQVNTFQTRMENQKRSQLRLDVTLTVGVLLSFSLLYLTYRVNVMYARERDRAEADILRLNEMLEFRVKERTSELEQRTLELQKSNADLSQFAYVASHDLQEPLRMVASYVGLLARRYRNKLDETADSYIQFAVDGASRMQVLINDLLVYSRAGTQAMQKESIESEIIVRQALANLSLAISESSALVQVNDLPTVEADAVKLTQVMQNLVANSLKFRKPEVPLQISVAATKVGPEWMFSVKDNGIGFDTRYTDKIFQIFQRLHEVGRYSGTGIGLAICKRIIEHHGGRVWADSEPGVGSTFFFTLPIFSEIKKR